MATFILLSSIAPIYRSLIHPILDVGQGTMFCIVPEIVRWRCGILGTVGGLFGEIDSIAHPGMDNDRVAHVVR